jgi:phage terminase Nu1 subunit (DNA packaging protein)
MAAIVTPAIVADALNLTQRRIAQLVHEGMPRKGRGKYDLWACAQWYIRFLQRAIEQRATENDDETTSNLTAEKKRLLRIRADREQLAYRKEAGEVIAAHLVDDKFVTFAGQIRERFLSLPTRIASQLEGESREVIRDKLYQSIRDQLNSLGADPNEERVASNGNADKQGNKRTARKVSRPRRAGIRSVA